MTATLKAGKTTSLHILQLVPMGTFVPVQCQAVNLPSDFARKLHWAYEELNIAYIHIIRVVLRQNAHCSTFASYSPETGYTDLAFSSLS